MGGTGSGSGYPEVYSKVKGIAATANLLDVSPVDALAANEDLGAQALVAGYIRHNFKCAMANCLPEVRSVVARASPEDVVDDTVQFKLPKFRALVFTRQGPLQRRNPQGEK